MRIVVTGANRGIGLGFVQSLIARGETVFATARDPRAAGELEALKGRAGGRLSIHALDLETPKAPSQLQELASAVAGSDGKGSLDWVINNAGIYPKDQSPAFSEKDLESWKRGFEVNTLGPARVMGALLPVLKQSRMPKAFHLTSKMGSVADNGSGGYFGYRISKAALNMFNKSLSIGEPGVVCVVLHPGWVQTDMGGAQAPVTVEESVKGLISVMDKAGKAETGRFFDYRGAEVPW